MHRRHGRRWAAPIAVFVSAVCALAPSARGQRARTPTPTAEPVQREAFERYRRATEARLHALERALEARTEAEAGAEAHAGDDLAALRAAAEAEARAGEEEGGETQGGAAVAAQPMRSFSSFLNALNPRITVFGDALAPIAVGEVAAPADDRFSVREVEVDFRAAVDPYANAVLIAAFEEEAPGEYGVGVEEAYISLDTLPWRLRAKIGRFFPQIGNANRLHTHDLPWPERPYASQDFVGGEEGWKENGLALSWLSPPLGPLTLTLTGWVLDGENPVVLAGGDSDDPAYMGRAEAHLSLGPRTFLTLGGNVLFGYNDPRGRQETHLGSADVLFQHKPDSWSSIVAMGELYGLDKEVADGREHGFGAWAALQLQPGLGHLWSPLRETYFGLRYDFSNYDEQTEGARQWALGGYVSFYTTEFLRFRFGYEHRERDTARLGRPDEERLYLQLTFVFGSHPVEPFWFNR